MRDQRDLAISAPALGKFESKELKWVVVGKRLFHCGQKELFYAQLSSTLSAQAVKQMAKARKVKIRQTIDLLVVGAKTKSVGRSTLASKLSFQLIVFNQNLKMDSGVIAVKVTTLLALAALTATDFKSCPRMS